MLAALPLLALGGCILICHRHESCWRESILQGAVLWGVVLVGSTELLSALDRLSLPWVVLTWFVTLACLAVALVVNRRHAFQAFHRFEPRDLAIPRFEPRDLAFYGPLAGIVLTLGALTIATAPNTWDAMTYHLARVMHWQQNGTLAPYPTHVLRQLYLQPGAEEVMLHLQILSGGDRLAGTVQWASMVGALVGTSLIATELGARPAGGVCAVAFAASIPIGVLESTSTQNDWVVTFWLVCMVAFGLRLVRTPSSPPALVVLTIAASLGLALVTKATAYLVALPFVVWLSVSALSRWRWRAPRELLLAALLVLALNAGFFLRNVTVFGSPLGPPDAGAPSLQYRNAELTPTLLMSNVVRDLGLNLVATGWEAVNIRGLNLVKALHQLIGVDIQDPRTTWGGELFREQRVELAFDENFASNPLHLVLLAFALLCLWPLRRRVASTVPPYTGALLSGALLFAAVLRWQPWDTRLELPFFVLAAPLFGVVCATLGTTLTLKVGGLLLLSMLPWVINSDARPLVGAGNVLFASRASEYFVFRPDLEPTYVAAVHFLADRHCPQIGFVSDQDGWEYPLWALSPGPVAIEHVGVTNLSEHVAPLPFQPCAILALGPEFTSKPLQVTGQTFSQAWMQGDVAVLLPDGS